MVAKRNMCCIFWPAFGVRSIPNSGRNSHFQRFCCKKPLKKLEICSKFQQKKFFLVCTRTLVDWHFIGKNGRRQAALFITPQISCFLKFFCTKNAENGHFDQQLECAAPKRWSKYTTNMGKQLQYWNSFCEP